MTKGFVTGLLTAVLLAALAWLGVVYSGIYNVAATEPHTDPVRWTFETTMHRSVAARAGELPDDLPERFDRATLAAGARHYAESCVLCHGAPGVEPEAWAQGMRPEPPHLVEAATEWSPAEIRWIITHGIKMAGMPAFGPHHDETEITAITAFVSRLPGFTHEDYMALTDSSRQP